MKIILTCTECPFECIASSERELMNKILMWNHVKKEHQLTADRIMRRHVQVPDRLYNTRPFTPNQQTPFGVRSS